MDVRALYAQGKRSPGKENDVQWKVLHEQLLKERGEDLEGCIESMGIKVYQESEIWAGVASGSFGVSAMAIIPTSMNTLAKIAYGMGDDLITRCASVMLKERKTLLLATREMPFSPIALENMSKLATLGVIIAPPILGYYSGGESLE